MTSNGKSRSHAKDSATTTRLNRLEQCGLPPRHYYTLPDACDMLGCTVSDLLYYGSVGIINVNVTVPSELTVCPYDAETKFKGISFAPPVLLTIWRNDCRRLECGETVERATFKSGYCFYRDEMLHKTTPASCGTGPFTGQFAVWKLYKGDRKRKVRIISERLVITRDDLEKLQAGDTAVVDDEMSDTSASARDHRSDQLMRLIQASEKFWANASREDRDAQPTNDKVTMWLADRGFSQSLARKGASIIRPSWAGNGRPPAEK